MAIDTWDPRQYDKFERQREQPFYDLLHMVRPGANMCIVDLGCGTGKLTRVMHERLHARQTIGIDRSESMLSGARSDRAGAAGDAGAGAIARGGGAPQEGRAQGAGAGVHDRSRRAADDDGRRRGAPGLQCASHDGDG